VKTPSRAAAQEILETTDASLLDLVDNLLNRGVVVSGEVVLGLAGVDLVYLRLSALLCAADRVEQVRRSS
jgi:gas vesicle protein GvpA/GvpJ/GvpM family